MVQSAEFLKFQTTTDTIELEQAPTKLQPIATMPQPTTKKLKPLIRLKILSNILTKHKPFTNL
jgi:hypothetical protein